VFAALRASAGAPRGPAAGPRGRRGRVTCWAEPVPVDPPTPVLGTVPVFAQNTLVAEFCIIGIVILSFIVGKELIELFFTEKYDYKYSGGMLRLLFEQKGGQDPYIAKRLLSVADTQKKVLALKEARIKGKYAFREAKRQLMLEGGSGQDEAVDDGEDAASLAPGSGPQSGAEATPQAPAEAQGDKVTKRRRRKVETKKDSVQVAVNDPEQLAQNFEDADALLEDAKAKSGVK